MATKDEIMRAAQAPVTEVRKAEAPQETIGTETLPPKGYGRQEVLRMRHDRLQQLIQERGEQIAFGIVDPNALTVDPEIARYYADILAVTNPQPDRQYCWVECGMRDNHPEHVHNKQMQGWKFVTLTDPECPDVPKSPQGHRRLGTTVLMWIEIERWIELKAHEHAQALKQRGDMGSADRMLEVAARHGAQVKVIENWNQLSPEARSLAEGRFVQRQRGLQQAWERIDQELKHGTAHLNYGNQRRGVL
jgi:hypothetical protein